MWIFLFSFMCLIYLSADIQSIFTCAFSFVINIFRFQVSYFLIFFLSNPCNSLQILPHIPTKGIEGINWPLFLSSGCTQVHVAVCAGVCWGSQEAVAFLSAEHHSHAQHHGSALMLQPATECSAQGDTVPSIKLKPNYNISAASPEAKCLIPTHLGEF